MPDSYTFSDLHDVIQEAMGWMNAHLYRFTDSIRKPTFEIIESEEDESDSFSNVMATMFGNVSYLTKEPHEVKLIDYFKGEKDRKILYEYDFGDSWVHEITLKAVVEDSRIESSGKWKYLAGKGACPPEDCGGPWGYERMKIALAEKEDQEEVEYFLEWLGLDSPEEFDPNIVAL